MLRATKHLEAQADRPFAALRVTRGHGHAEGNEASRGPWRQALRCAQGDKGALRVTRRVALALWNLDLCLRLMQIGADNEVSQNNPDIDTYIEGR